MSAPTRELPRMLAHYRETIAPALQSEFNYDNVMQIPRLTKIVVNMGVGEATRDAKLMDGAVRDLTAITGQKPAGRPSRANGMPSASSRANASASDFADVVKVTSRPRT